MHEGMGPRLIRVKALLVENCQIAADGLADAQGCRVRHSEKPSCRRIGLVKSPYSLMIKMKSERSIC